MLKIFKKIILTQIVLLFIFVGGIPTSVYGQAQNQTIGDYVLLVPNLPGIDGNTTTLDKYIPAAINLAIGIAAGMAFVVITFGGVTYATTDALGGKQKGREMIQDAVVGLLLVIGAYAILYTINPQMLAFNLDIKAARISATPSIESGGTAGCPTCTSLSAANIPMKPGIAGTTVSNSIKSQLVELNGRLSGAGVDWQVTEAYPPTPGVNHKNDCHRNGTCVDANVKNPTPQNINAFAQKAKDSGLTPVYEVATEQERRDLIAAGVTARIDVEKVTAPHFSVYR